VRQSADRTTITVDGEDLTFITAQIIDSKGNVVPTANNAIQLQVSNPGVIVATNNGFLENLTKFPSTKAWSAI
jgi:beta-galactosidase